MAERSREPFFWLLFSSGGMVAALLLPVLFARLWLAPALGWVDGATHGGLAAGLASPIVRSAVFALVTLCAFHWGHRFRFTLYDGLQLKHLFGLIAVICYGGAMLVSGFAAWVLWTFPAGG